MIVELDAFSGRPNPSWQLDEARAGELVELHRRLTATTERPPEPPGLGYRGFLYSLDGTAWRAWAGFVTAGDRALADPDRAIERLLLASLPTEYADFRPRIAKEIERADFGGRSA